MRRRTAAGLPASLDSNCFQEVVTSNSWTNFELFLIHLSHISASADGVSRVLLCFNPGFNQYV